MIIQNSSGGLDNLLQQLLRSRAQADSATQVQGQPAPPVKKSTSQDIISLSNKASDNKSDNRNANPSQQNQSALVSDDVTEVENGYRRTQEFSRGDKLFTRIEEVTSTPERSKRIVIQQNESGATTALENIIDRQEDGSFRLIQRFTDETGETKTNVTYDFSPNDADILLGRPPAPSQERTDNPFQTLRGTQLDLSA